VLNTSIDLSSMAFWLLDVHFLLTLQIALGFQCGFAA